LHVTLPAYAKINLTLDVLGRRDDGYHNLASVMQTVALCDFVTITTGAADIELTSSRADLPTDSTNLAYRAVQLLQQQAGLPHGIRVHLEKNIPVAAGLAGGSTDAAAVLLGLNYLFALRLTTSGLIRLGASLGADVPFCLLGGTALARGAGERITALPPAPPMWFVLVKPAFGVATATVYREWDRNPHCRHRSRKVVKALAGGEKRQLITCLGNDLEAVVLKMHPEVGVIKERLLAAGVQQAVMCGSGPTVYGIVPDEEKARSVALFFRKDYPEVFVTHTVC